MASPESSPPGLSAEDIDALGRLSERYAQIKLFIAYAEEIQLDHKADILVYKELRDGFDHLMRVLFSRLSLKATVLESPDEYRNINIEKSIGHVYRAAFDALDATILSFKEHINSNLQGYSREAVVAVIPDYYKLKIKLNKLTNRAAERRGKKDIGVITDIAFEEYVDDVTELKTLHTNIINAGPDLDEYKKGLFWEKWKGRIWSVSLVFIGIFLKILYDLSNST
jgi:hypothetical protein